MSSGIGSSSLITTECYNKVVLTLEQHNQSKGHVSTVVSTVAGPAIASAAAQVDVKIAASSQDENPAQPVEASCTKKLVISAVIITPALLSAVVAMAEYSESDINLYVFAAAVFNGINTMGYFFNPIDDPSSIPADSPIVTIPRDAIEPREYPYWRQRFKQDLMQYRDRILGVFGCSVGSLSILTGNPIQGVSVIISSLMKPAIVKMDNARQGFTGIAANISCIWNRICGCGR